jgi:beta-RFAP synthase
MGRTKAGEVRVLAPARLHLGFLDMNGGLGRCFGSLGLALDELGTRLRLMPAAVPAAEGPDAERALLAQRRLLDAWGGPPARVIVEETIPAHVGLGSGTQLGLAVGAGLARLQERAVTAVEIGQLLERGARSGIGIGAFATGGFLLDGGKGADEAPPPIVARQDFPPAWRVILVLDGQRRGLSGPAERAAFRALPDFPAERSAHLCRLALMRLLPGLATRDIAAVGAAIGEIQRLVGDHFAAAQGGRFTSPAVTAALDWLMAEGVAGVGQSSWGPTGFAILEDAARAAFLCREAARRFAGDGLELRVLRGRNRGGEVTADASPMLGSDADRGA